MNDQPNSQKESRFGIGKIVLNILLLISGSVGCLLFLYCSAYSMNSHYQKEINLVHSNVEVVSSNSITSSNNESLDKEAYIEIFQEDEGTFYPVAEENVVDPNEGGIHRYEYYKDDCTWTQAFNKASAAGGYLARINSKEEYDYIVNQLSGSNFDGMVIFQIGGRRDLGSKEYYWVNENNEMYGDCINSSNYWATEYCWMENEPSYTDSYDGKTTDEDKLVLYNLNGNWAFNDSTDGIVGWYPGYSGKVGYIVEYEN